MKEYKVDRDHLRSRIEQAAGGRLFSGPDAARHQSNAWIVLDRHAQGLHRPPLALHLTRHRRICR